MADAGIQIKPNEFTLKRPRQWGACWIFCQVWDLLGGDYSVAAKDTLYRCMDKLVAHKKDLFRFYRDFGLIQVRWFVSVF